MRWKFAAFVFFIACVALSPVPTVALSGARLHLRGENGPANANIDLQGHPIAMGRLVSAPDANEKSAESLGKCTDLHNMETHFAIKVKLGTPMRGEAEQTFNLVADTGSNAVIVSSCICAENQLCDPEDSCFKGTNHSSTFSLMQTPQSRKRSVLGRRAPELGPVGVRLNFGSGALTSVIASDVVEVAGVHAQMDDGVLLMVDRSEMQVDGPFEGIFGLGPHKGTDVTKHRNASSQPFGQALGNQLQAPQGSGYIPKLFMEEAGVERFTMCFNDGDSPGALRLNVPEFQSPLPSIGSQHWGLGLFGIHLSNGVSGDSNQSPAIFCEPGSMKEGQESPCGAIPDSGTTLLMGPKAQVIQLFETLCDNWDRCRTARQGNLKEETKSDAFQKLLYTCADWLTDESGVNEIPPIMLMLGVPGNLQRVELPAASYIVESDEEIHRQNVQYLMGVVPVDIPKGTGKFHKVCSPSFGVQEYHTLENGPIWTLGAPLFYQYTVGYGLGTKGGGSSMAFLQQKCDLCNATSQTGASYLQVSEESHLHHERARPMRRVSKPPRISNLDKSLPL